MARQRRPPPPTIPAEIRDAAAAERAAEEDRRRASRERAEREYRCEEAVRAFRAAVDALNPVWAPQPEQADAALREARTLLPDVRAALLEACAALAGAGRLDAWQQVDHDQTYSSFRVRNYRALSRTSYDWARELFDRARAGQLPEELLLQTWEEEGLRAGVRWLWTFVYGLSGEGAPLPGAGQQLVVPATTNSREPDSVPAAVQYVTRDQIASEAPPPPKPRPRKLSATERKILAHCRRKAHTGERISFHVALSYDHVRRVLARLVKEKRLRTTDDGYRTVK
jgi:hypothetical protein